MRKLLLLREQYLIFYSTLDFKFQTTKTLLAMDEALGRFHKHKDIFVEKGIRTGFNIPKVHAMVHYVAKIRRLGTTDGFNTETTERLHIDMAKEAYRASNRRDYHAQMTCHLARLESLELFDEYLAWKHDKGADSPNSTSASQAQSQPSILGKRTRQDCANDVQPKQEVQNK